MTGRPDDVGVLLAQAVRLREAGRPEEARARLLELRDRFPDDAQVAYQTAWVHDTLGLEAQAVPHYVDALALPGPGPGPGHGPGLDADDRKGAMLGLGSTYRTLGRYAEAVATLSEATAAFPADNALKTFLAMALYNAGHAHDAMRVLLTVLAATSADPDIAGYRRAIEHYAQDLDAVEGAT
ncbi:tetratricopeptide repeat protein [Streptomyces sp. NPDC049813]|uniref:tetratricopeptide repeat protein n=1 Tax=Streptomyces sp. NPDC049813 TaxID=3365597 RepID=UPI0037A93DDD